MYIDRIWPFTTFISRNKHNKNIRLRLYWLRLRVAEAEVQTSHSFSSFLILFSDVSCKKLISGMRFYFQTENSDLIFSSQFQSIMSQGDTSFWGDTQVHNVNQQVHETFTFSI